MQYGNEGTGGGHLGPYQRRNLGIDPQIDPQVLQLLLKAGIHVAGYNQTGGTVPHPGRMASPGPGLSRPPHRQLRPAFPGPSQQRPQMPLHGAFPADDGGQSGIPERPYPGIEGGSGQGGIGGLIPLPNPQQGGQHPIIDQLMQRLMAHAQGGGGNQDMLRQVARGRQVAQAMQHLQKLQGHPALRHARPA